MGIAVQLCSSKKLNEKICEGVCVRYKGFRTEKVNGLKK